jgi:hypothetical protein
MNWVYALRRLRAANARATFNQLIASLGVGQRVLYVRPLTEGAKNWEASWTQLVRRRSAQFGALFQADVSNGTLKLISVAPHYYRGACCVANSATLYERVR